MKMVMSQKMKVTPEDESNEMTWCENEPNEKCCEDTNLMKQSDE